MKNTFITFLIVFSLSASAQEAPADTAMAESISASDSAAYHYGNRTGAPDPAKEKIVYRRVFQVRNAGSTDDIYTRALSFARTMSVNFREDKRKKTIRIPVRWGYHGASNDCIEDLAMEGEMIVEIKGDKTRLSLTDIRYTHHDRKDSSVKGVAKSDVFSRKPDCAPEKGKVELLYQCSACPQSIKHLTADLAGRFDVYARQYQDALRWY